MYTPKHKWKDKKSGRCRFCNIPDCLNDENVCPDCYATGIEREYWKLIRLLKTTKQT